jgi:hypothetical protein
MTAKELLLQVVPKWTEHDAAVALRAVEDEHQAENGDTVDEWGTLSALTDAAAGDLMDRLAEEEAAAGLEPW